MSLRHRLRHALGERLVEAGQVLLELGGWLLGVDVMASGTSGTRVPEEVVPITRATVQAFVPDPAGGEDILTSVCAECGRDDGHTRWCTMAVPATFRQDAPLRGSIAERMAQARKAQGE